MIAPADPYAAMMVAIQQVIVVRENRINLVAGTVPAGTLSQLRPPRSWNVKEIPTPAVMAIHSKTIHVATFRGCHAPRNSPSSSATGIMICTKDNVTRKQQATHAMGFLGTSPRIKQSVPTVRQASTYPAEKATRKRIRKESIICSWVFVFLPNVSLYRRAAGKLVV
jgi:hypothetical protein